MSEFLRGLNIGIAGSFVANSFRFSNPFCYANPFMRFTPMCNFRFMPFFNPFPNFFGSNFLYSRPQMPFMPYVGTTFNYEPTNFVFNSSIQQSQTQWINPTQFFVSPSIYPNQQVYSSSIIGDSFERKEINDNSNINQENKPNTELKQETPAPVKPNTEVKQETELPGKQKQESSQKQVKNNVTFDTMFNIILNREGGLNPNEPKINGPGKQKSYKGVLQSTYDDYRKKNGLPTRNIDAGLESGASDKLKAEIEAEIKDIYYTMYYKPIGADKIKDPILALYLFDTAVNMGVGGVTKRIKAEFRQDAETFKKARIIRYCEISKVNICNKKLNDMSLAEIKNMSAEELDSKARAIYEKTKNNYKIIKEKFDKIKETYKETDQIYIETKEEYNSIAEKYNNMKNLRGWLNRIRDLDADIQTKIIA